MAAVGTSSGKSVPFSSGTLEGKLRDLNSTMQSIQGVSQWLISHKKHAKSAVGVWFREVQKASSHKKLTLLYLANDVVQNARRKGPEFKTEFVKALPRALHLIAKDKDENVTKAVMKVLSVWEERHVFEEDVTTKFKAILSNSGHRPSKSEAEVRRTSEELTPVVVNEVTPPPDKPPNERDPPESDELLKLMMTFNGDKSTMQDMVQRQTIANFPSRLYDIDILSKLKTKESCQELLNELQQPLETLTQYTEKMEEEMKQRQELEEVLDSFIWHHQCLLYQARERQKEYQHKMEQCLQVKEILKSHIASLPDLAAPSSEKLAPLPSAGDLFS